MPSNLSSRQVGKVGTPLVERHSRASLLVPGIVGIGGVLTLLINELAISNRLFAIAMTMLVHYTRELYPIVHLIERGRSAVPCGGSACIDGSSGIRPWQRRFLNGTLYVLAVGSASGFPSGGDFDGLYGVRGTGGTGGVGGTGIFRGMQLFLPLLELVPIKKRHLYWCHLQ